MKNNFHKLFTYSTKLTEFFYAGPMFYPDMENMPGDDGEWMIFFSVFQNFLWQYSPLKKENWKCANPNDAISLKVPSYCDWITKK